MATLQTLQGLRRPLALPPPREAALSSAAGIAATSEERSHRSPEPERPWGRLQKAMAYSDDL